MTSPTTYEEFHNSQGTLDIAGGPWHCTASEPYNCGQELTNITALRECGSGPCLVGWLTNPGLQPATMYLSTQFALNLTEYPIGDIFSYSLVFYVRPLTTTPMTTTTSTTQPSTATSSAATSSETDALIRRKPSDINIVYSVAGQNFTEGADFANPGEPDKKISSTGNVTITGGMFSIQIQATYPVGNERAPLIAVRFHDIDFQFLKLEAHAPTDTVQAVSNAPKKVNPGVISSAVLGSIIFLLLIANLIWWLYRRKSSPKKQINGHSHVNYGEINTSEYPSPESRTFLFNSSHPSSSGGPTMVIHPYPSASQLEVPPNYQNNTTRTEDALTLFSKKHRDLILPDLEQKLRAAGYNPKRSPDAISSETWWERYRVTELELSYLKEAYQSEETNSASNQSHPSHRTGLGGASKRPLISS